MSTRKKGIDQSTSLLLVVVIMLVLVGSNYTAQAAMVIGEGIPIKYNEDNDDGEVTVNWGSELFEKPSTSYNNDLALVAAALNAAAGNSKTDDIHPGYFIAKAFDSLGFEEKNVDLFNYPDHPLNRELNNTVGEKQKLNEENYTIGEHAFAIANKAMSINGEKTNVIVVVLRGTETTGESREAGAAAANDDFLGYKVHGYFLRFMNRVLAGLVDHIKRHSEIKDGNVKILIAGHSLGGAAANLLAAKLTDEWDSAQASEREWYEMLERIKYEDERQYNILMSFVMDFRGDYAITGKDDIYAFTFGALNSFNVRETGDYRTGFEHIRNFFNYYDTFGPHGDGAAWFSFVNVASGKDSCEYKFGEIIEFQINYKGLFRRGDERYMNHVMPCYLNAIEATLDRHKAVDLLGGFVEKALSLSTQYAVKNSVPVRKEPYESSAVVRRLVKGEMVNIQSYIRNTYGNYWYRLSDGWVYYENTTPIANPFDSILKVFSIKCPVDADVYDSSGDLVASIIDNTPSLPSDTVVPCALGDLKLFYILGTQEYILKLTATAEGYMSFTAQQYDLNKDDLISVKSFSSVHLIDGKLMQSTVSGHISTDDVRLYISDENGTPTNEIQIDGTETIINTETISLESITLNKDTVTLEAGQTETLTVTYSPDNTTDDKTVIWSSSNENVAEVTGSVITAKAAGTATVTATVGNFSVECKVTVTEQVPVITDIEITQQPDRVEYLIGEQLNLSGLVVTAKYGIISDQILTDYSTNPVEGSALGTAGIVTVIVSYEGKTASFDITVMIPEPEPESTPLAVSVSTPTIVETLSAYLNIAVTGDDIADKTLAAYLKVGEELLYGTPVTDGYGRMFITAAPVAGDYELIVLADDKSAAGSCAVEVTAYNTDIWVITPTINLEGFIVLVFNEEISAKDGKFDKEVSLNGRPASCTLDGDSKSLVTDVKYSDLPDGENTFTATGVKYPRLFPSYFFTFTAEISK